MHVEWNKNDKARPACVFCARTPAHVNRGRAATALFERCRIFFARHVTKNWKKSTKFNKIHEKLHYAGKRIAPPGKPTKNFPASKNRTKFQQNWKLSILRDYNTYIRKVENFNFVRFKGVIHEFCCNFVGQQNSNKILFLLEFYGVRGSSILLLRLFFSERKSLTCYALNFSAFVLILSQFCSFCSILLQ